MKNKEVLWARKFTQIYLLFGFLSEDLTTLTQKPVKLNYENKNEPDSLGIYSLIIMFACFEQNLLI